MFEQLLRDNFLEFYLHDSMSQGEGFHERNPTMEKNDITHMLIQVAPDDEAKHSFRSIVVGDVRTVIYTSSRAEHTHTHTMHTNTCSIIIFFPFF